MDTGKRLREKKMYSPNVNIWVKFHDFSKISKQVTLDNLINSDEDIYNNAVKLFNSIWNPDSDKKIRALCVGVANLTDVYAHILDEDRKVNAQKFESAFYATAPDLREVKPPQEKTETTIDIAALIEQLQSNPELAATLAGLIGVAKK